jgi:hypothetical protein
MRAFPTAMVKVSVSQARGCPTNPAYNSCAVGPLVLARRAWAKKFQNKWKSAGIWEPFEDMVARIGAIQTFLYVT